MQFTSDWFTPWIPDWERLFVPLLQSRLLHGMEIGCHEGRSTIWTLQRMLTHPQATLDCLDWWSDPAVEARFDANLEESQLNTRIHKRRGRSCELLAQLLLQQPRREFHWIYIDGSHEARDCLLDAALAFQVLAPGGILCFDDYLWKCTPGHHLPPRPAIECFLNLWGDQVELLHAGYQVAVQRTRSSG